MTVIQAVILGLVQGLTEFLPVSSSGHLVLVPYLFNWISQDISFDVALHFGTALAVLLFFYRDWLDMFTGLKNDIWKKNLNNSLNLKALRSSTKQLLTIILVSIPVGVAGILFEDLIEGFFRNPASVAGMLIFVSFIMLFAEYVYKKTSHKIELTFIDSLIISLSQVLALIPGTSRSGITISTGLYRGIERESVAKFSFLLATPIILGATFIKLPDLFSGSSSDLINIVLGIATSFVSGMLAISFLLKYLRQNTLKLFIVYRIILGIVILVIVL